MFCSVYHKTYDYKPCTTLSCPTIVVRDITLWIHIFIYEVNLSLIHCVECVHLTLILVRCSYNYSLVATSIWTQKCSEGYNFFSYS